jgi:hypothetical protein
VIIPQPNGRTGFNASPDIKATSDTNPSCLGTQMPMLGDPKLLTRDTQAYQN